MNGLFTTHNTSMEEIQMKKQGLLASLGLALLMVVIVGCGNDPTGTGESVGDSFFSTITKSPTYGQMYVHSMWTRQSGSASYECGGQVFNNTDHDSLVSGGAMVVSGRSADERFPGSYLTMKVPLFGSVTTWSLSGNSSTGIPAVMDSMYVPSEIRILSPNVKTVSRSQDLTIQWNVDPNNDLVKIQVRDATEPTGTPTGQQYNWNLVVPDNGSYTVSSSVLSNIPTDGLAVVTLTRGESKTIGTTHKFHIYGYTSGADAYRLTQ